MGSDDLSFRNEVHGEGYQEIKYPDAVLPNTLRSLCTCFRFCSIASCSLGVESRSRFLDL